MRGAASSVTRSGVWEGLTSSPVPVHAGTMLQDTFGILFSNSLLVCLLGIDPRIEMVLEFTGALRRADEQILK